MEKITPEQAAKILKMDPQNLRAGLRSGKIPWGTAFKTSEVRERYTYVIYPKAFREYVGEI